MSPRDHTTASLGRALRRIATTLALTLGPASIGCARTPPPSLPSSLYGTPMPSFERRSLDGREVSSKRLHGQIVVIEFFASYCEPCKRSLPAIVKLARRDHRLRVVAIGEDERLDLTAKMAADYGLTMPVLHDTSNVLAARFRIDGLPSTFVVDERGTIRWIGGAAHDTATLARVIQAIRDDPGPSF